jgi:hypothetical protein
MSTIMDGKATPCHEELPAHKTATSFAAQIGYPSDGGANGKPLTHGKGGKSMSEAGAIPTPPGGFDSERGK